MPHVVVVPLSTLPNWEREFAKWAPHLNVVVLHGNQASRDLIKKHELFAPGVKNADLQVRLHWWPRATLVCLSALTIIFTLLKSMTFSFLSEEMWPGRAMSCVWVAL